jgi:hypothetical protein
MHLRRQAWSRAGRRSGSDPTTVPDQLFDLVALLVGEAAELILHVKPSLAAQVEQVLALHVQLARQDINSNSFFFLMQAELLLSDYRGAPAKPAARGVAPVLLL